MKDAFDPWWEWAAKPHESMLSVDGDIHYPIMELSPEDRRDREKVNEAVRRYRENRKCNSEPFAGAQNREQPMVIIKPRRKRAKSYAK